jgi:hypothetical protein
MEIKRLARAVIKISTINLPWIGRSVLKIVTLDGEL